MRDARIIIKLPELEAYQLSGHEGRLEAKNSSFVEVGKALSAIRYGKLYRATHGTFEDYCREKWNMDKAHWNRMISLYELMGDAPSLIPDECECGGDK
jgi:hypothetical protein